MRNAFAKEISLLAAADPRVVLLSGDIGNQLFEPYKAAHPGRFYNCGVAEANMMSTAAGLALTGLRPVAYTIAPFLTTRCYEQIRVDVCYHRVGVTIVGVGAGLSYASLGSTHHSLEDIAIMRALPHMQVLCPADAHEVRSALRYALGQPDPVYIRMGKKGEPVIHAETPQDVQPIRLQTGTDACLICTGTLLPEALEAARLVAEQGMSLEVYSSPQVKPLDLAWWEQLSQRFPLLVTAEEHGLIGGLGSAVAEMICDHGWSCRLLRLGAPDEFMHEAGETAHTRSLFGLDASAMAGKILARRIQVAR